MYAVRVDPSNLNAVCKFCVLVCEIYLLDFSLSFHIYDSFANSLATQWAKMENWKIVNGDN